MHQKGRKQGTVRFKLRLPEGTRRAAVAGDFNGWRPAPMRRQKDGSFAATLVIPPGRYEYKFTVDGDWVHDPDVAEVVMNSYRTFNSVVVVE